MNNNAIGNVSKNEILNKDGGFNDCGNYLYGVFGEGERDVEGGKYLDEVRVGIREGSYEISLGNIMERGVESGGGVGWLRKFILRSVMGCLDLEYDKKCRELSCKCKGYGPGFINFCFEVWVDGIGIEELEEINKEEDDFFASSYIEKMHRENFESKEARSCFLDKIIWKFVKYLRFTIEEKKEEGVCIVMLLGSILKTVIEPKIRADVFEEQDRKAIKRYSELVSVLMLEGFMEDGDFYELFPVCGKERIYGDKVDVMYGEIILLLGKSPKEEHRLLVGRVKTYDEKMDEMEGFKRGFLSDEER